MGPNRGHQVCNRTKLPWGRVLCGSLRSHITIHQGWKVKLGGGGGWKVSTLFRSNQRHFSSTTWHGASPEVDTPEGAEGNLRPSRWLVWDSFFGQKTSKTYSHKWVIGFQPPAPPPVEGLKCLIETRRSLIVRQTSSQAAGQSSPLSDVKLFGPNFPFLHSCTAHMYRFCLFFSRGCKNLFFFCIFVFWRESSENLWCFGKIKVLNQRKASLFVFLPCERCLSAQFCQGDGADSTSNR